MVHNGIQSQYTRVMGALKPRNKSWWMENCSNETLDLGDEFNCINLTGFLVKAARVTRWQE